MIFQTWYNSSSFALARLHCRRLCAECSVARRLPAYRWGNYALVSALPIGKRPRAAFLSRRAQGLAHDRVRNASCNASKARRCARTAVLAARAASGRNVQNRTRLIVTGLQRDASARIASAKKCRGEISWSGWIFRNRYGWAVAED
jgi:hypothetical protein